MLGNFIATAVDPSVTQVISSVGFPIFMCLIMAYFYKDLMTKVLDGISKMNEAINKMNETVSDNTNIIKILIDKLGENNGK